MEWLLLGPVSMLGSSHICIGRELLSDGIPHEQLSVVCLSSAWWSQTSVGCRPLGTLVLSLLLPLSLVGWWQGWFVVLHPIHPLSSGSVPIWFVQSLG